MSKVTELLDELHDGSKSVDEVAAEFSSMSWPKGPARPTTYLALAKADMGDPTPEVDGSFDEVSTAYALGRIDDKQYAVLAKAAAGKPSEKPPTDKAPTSK